MPLLKLSRIALHSSAEPQLNAAGLAALARSMGINAIDLRLQSRRGHGLHLDSTEERIEEVRHIFAAHGVSICCLSSPLRIGIDNDEAAHKILHIARILGAPIVRTFLAPLREKECHSSFVDRLGAVLDRWIPNYANYGVEIVVENHGEWASIAEIAMLFPRVGLLWDLGQSLLRRESAGDVSPFANRLLHIHIKDTVVDAAGRRFVPLFDGQCDVADALLLARRGGFAGFLSLETSPLTIQTDVLRLRQWMFDAVIGADYRSAENSASISVVDSSPSSEKS